MTFDEWVAKEWPDGVPLTIDEDRIARHAWDAATTAERAKPCVHDAARKWSEAVTADIFGGEGEPS